MKKNGESNNELPPPPSDDNNNNNEDDVSYLEVHREELLPAGAIPPPNHAELEEEAAQHATQASIRSSHGAFAVTPGQNNSIEPRVFTADDAPSSSRQSSGGAAVAGSSLGATGTLLSDGGGSNNNTPSNNGGRGTGGANYSGNYLPANPNLCRSVAWQRACMNSTLLTWSSRAEQFCAIGLRMARARGHVSASQ